MSYRFLSSAVATLLALGFWSGQDPLAKAPTLTEAPNPAAKKAEMPSKDQNPRPTSKEEFAALAKEGPKPPWIRFQNQKYVLDERIEGTVVDVSREFIEVRPKGKKETVKFPPYTLLDTGAVCHWVYDGECYLLDDVQKGDVVILGVGTVDKDRGSECFYVSIRQRPGGVIPPSRKPRDKNPYHLDKQRELDYHARGEKTPEDLRTEEQKRQLNIERGLLPAPPLVASDPAKKGTGGDPPKKKDEK